MNNLHNEKSPYLLQHLDNPVDWYPWGEEAFSLARRENRLVFLSIGYSTCHWCHVMAHESFADREVAELLNQDFVSIKVDREERPDIDQVYMEVCQRLTGSGGWPLTVIMTPYAHPFYAATYLPKRGRRGRPGMMELLPWMADKWREDPGFLQSSADEVLSLLKKRPRERASSLPEVSVFAAAEKALKSSFDHRYGGFSRAPKFPRPHDLVFLLSRYSETGDSACLAMVEQTLLKMRCGGIYDQLGFGFHRYATDQQWLLPHFEKMLYDQAGLISAYLAAWQVTGNSFYADTVKEVIAYLSRDLLTEGGAFCSAEDADSEGEEGKFYVWSHHEVEAVLAEPAQSFCQAYHVKRSGNFHDEVSGRLSGNNIFHFSAADVSEAAQVVRDFSPQRDRLLAARSQRIRPHLDDKVITAWNGMALSALAESARLLGEDGFRRLAERLAEFLLLKMRRDGRLLRRYRLGEASIQGFAEDYACMAKGLLDLYNLTLESRYLLSACSLAESLAESFQDKDSGRLFDTSHDAEQLLVRPSSAFDGAMPAASSVALEVFARLALLSGQPSWRQAAEALLQSLATELASYPAGYTALLSAARWLLQPTREIVITGERGDATTEAMLSAVLQSDLKQTVVLFYGGDDAELLSFAPQLDSLPSNGAGATAYLCSDLCCQAPVTDLASLENLLARDPDS